MRCYLPATSRTGKRATVINAPSSCAPDTTNVYVPACSEPDGMATLIESGEFASIPSCFQISSPRLPITAARYHEYRVASISARKTIQRASLGMVMSRGSDASRLKLSPKTTGARSRLDRTRADSLRALDRKSTRLNSSHLG